RPPDARGPGGVMTMESILGYMERYDYENLFICQDRSVGLRAVIAIHDTTLGPATGGTRMWTYPSEMDAIEDALRLARGMTYKYAAAGVNLGGGKCVILGDPRREKSEMLFRAQGRGAVGSEVVPLLVRAGARVVVSDIDGEKVETITNGYSVTAAPPDEIAAHPADIFCPCALGGIINAETIPRFRVKIICGSA